ncbi:ribonuclease H family protein [Neorhodopirellula pilleata]|uniref:Uncharacterized protein n=1 Tax=Neorhodopirellula pilleata TaxID=2714738 RepID=A0A5C6AAI3_9BACT|nr:hypothetical protein [Neorhodopirellula pilleata]TWT96569.1 hypothetical protein Pla100_30520 [Neorhodopirellula pilleata]
MWLIAIDEAGYGPKLGPLVVAGTLWRRVDAAFDVAMSDRSIDAADPDAFAPIAAPVRVQATTIRVDDSKQIFRSRSSGKNGGSLATLHRIVSVAHHASGRTEPDLARRIATLIPDDIARIAAVPWLASLASSPRLQELVETAWTPKTDCGEAINRWAKSPWRLIDVRARMIDAAHFNRFCGAADGANKSDLLGETSIGLAADWLATIESQRADDPSPTSEPVQVYFDRHGGRRYYAGPIQQQFGETPVRVIAESARQSVYETGSAGRTMRMHFSVKGDRFVPVALSSLHAKYLREVAMASLNDYFRKRWEAASSDGLPAARSASNGTQNDSAFKPTAGYPTDADRFLTMIAAAIKADKISMDDLVRCR